MSHRAAFVNDVDSDGEEPPEGTFVNPESIDESLAAPPRTNEPLSLPFYKPRERPPLREEFESRISYEDWVEEDEAVAGQRSRVGARRLDRDSDFPVGRLYFWHAFCARCNRTYHPHVPGKWECVVCKEKVWQQPENPESKTCAVCRRDMAKLIVIAGHRVRNPMSLNGHMCKRCGRAVCDNCYAPTPMGGLEDWGFAEPERVCTRCVRDMETLKRPPAEEDQGTRYDETVGGNDDVLQCYPFWHPKCRRCNITFAMPPKRWACTSCGVAVWQPIDVPDSQKCWLCGAAAPKERCHHCGQLMCLPCGQFARPVPERGFMTGAGLTVCKACYGGACTVDSKAPPDPARVTLAPSHTHETFRATCPDCKQSLGAPPEKWTSKCHNKRAWQHIGAEPTTCKLCSIPVASTAAQNCHRCGWAMCPSCCQYKEPVPDRGFPKTTAMPVCRACYDPTKMLAPDTFDLPAYWPPQCPKCARTFEVPPERWRCPMQCGLVWQPTDHIASMSCAACGRKVGHGSVNCRKCGRIVCGTCGEGRAEVPERGFGRGVQYPVCTRCVPPVKPVAMAAAPRK